MTGSNVGVTSYQALVTSAAPAIFLSFDKTSGVLSAGNSDSITVTANSTGLAPGIYSANLLVSTNDAAQSSVNVLVALGVETGEPNDVASLATPITYGDSLVASLGVRDVDYYMINAQAGDIIDVWTRNTSLFGLGLSGFLKAFDATGNLAAEDDDFLSSSASRVFYRVPLSGTYYIRFADRLYPPDFVSTLGAAASLGENFHRPEDPKRPTPTSASVGEYSLTLKKAAVVNILSRFASTVPTIDGTLAGEWTDASETNFAFPTQTKPVWLYLKHSSGKLFLAVVDSNHTPTNGDYLLLYVDKNNSNSFDPAPPSGDGRYTIRLDSSASPVTTILFEGIYGTFPPAVFSEAPITAAPAVTAAFGTTAGRPTYEAVFDLATSKIQVSAGGTFGFYLRSFNRFGFAQTMTGEIPAYLVATNSLFQPGVYAKVTLQLPTSVEAVGSAIPARYSLIQNYPNPFNPSTKIKYDLPKDGHTELRVADLLGREVAILVDELQAAGSYSVTFNANRLSSGIYFYTLQSGTFRETMKMMVLK
jgi:hypothetical protein